MGDRYEKMEGGGYEPATQRLGRALRRTSRRGSEPGVTGYEQYYEPTDKKLDQDAQSKAHGGMACYACGGAVDAEGMATGGEVDDTSERSEFVEDNVTNDRGDTSQMTRDDELDTQARKGFVRAVKGMR